ncbi:hypothetical protein PAXRUDRAFT_14892 [Paxillus rubicundulus Ve08.2h10]|uniref:Uncharacterized protein n=1 Tax=Paxillus rubicundulus Ve08.2h10 TaxID=930991 RepID=A0A0D0CHF2_9AGAM|nr:hypothetical protein PAXRUDRAFT_14892 [Paxillus rubicundulus Ve08.2h10]
MPVPMEVDDEDVTMDDGIIGQDIVEEYQNLKNNVNKKKKAVEPLTDPEINIIQGKLQSITCPTWHRGPPTNLGEAEHGKLKAEQWHSSIKFDLPVILYRLWGCGTASGEPEEEKQSQSAGERHT